MKGKEKAEQSGSLKAKMSVVLKANDVVVAEVDDAALWNSVFSAINAGSSQLALPHANSGGGEREDVPGGASMPAASASGTDPLAKFARELSISVDLLKGACDPTLEEPYFHLDSFAWERMKKDLPMRGPKAMPPIVLAASLLCLWSRHANLGTVTQSQAQAVLATIGVRDSNASRGIQSAEWLQGRSNGHIILNPAQVSKAVTVASCFCKQDWGAWKSL